MNEANEKKKHLSNDVNEALRQLVTISKRLVQFTDQETQSLIKQDHMNFALVQRDKERLADRYAKACAEFQDRLEEFRKADKGLILQLDQTQNSLREKTENNNDMIARIKDRAQANTQATLFSAQEMGQRVIIHNDNSQQEASA